MEGGYERVAFGFRQVPVAEKQGMVDAVFHKVAARYDRMNDVMSAGFHRIWKNAMIDWLAPPRAGRRPYRVLDEAGGTGDIAFRIAERAERAEITVSDINPSMLAVGRDRAAGKRFADRLRFVEANAEALPFENGEFDAVTIAFGIRNVTRIDAAISEAHRVLKHGGRFMVLEFSQVDVALLDSLYEFYSFNVIPTMGQIVAGEAQPYQYLVESIRRFPNQARFAAMLEAGGFERVSFRNLSGGIVAIHSGWKL